jgi:hypothetical protein
MEEWDPAINDFVLGAIVAGEQTSMSNYLYLKGKILL